MILSRPIDSCFTELECSSAVLSKVSETLNRLFVGALVYFTGVDSPDTCSFLQLHARFNSRSVCGSSGQVLHFTWYVAALLACGHFSY
jgi:hypothetical protein